MQTFASQKNIFPLIDPFPLAPSLLSFNQSNETNNDNNGDDDKKKKEKHTKDSGRKKKNLIECSSHKFFSSKKNFFASTMSDKFDAVSLQILNIFSLSAKENICE